MTRMLLPLIAALTLACGGDSTDDAPRCKTFRCDEAYVGPQSHETWDECVTCDEASDTCVVELKSEDGDVFERCTLCIGDCADACEDGEGTSAVIYCTGSL